MRGRLLWPPAVPRLAARPSQSNHRGSGPEVLKREGGHVTSETGVAEVGVFGAFQPNVFAHLIEMCYRMSFTQWLITGKINFHPITVIWHFVGWIWKIFWLQGHFIAWFLPLLRGNMTNIVCIDTATYDTICISLTLAIRYIDESLHP